MNKKMDGFTLIETLVALVLVSVTLVIILQTFSSGLASINTSESYNLSVFFAREKMEELFLFKKLSPGIMEGTFNDRYRWEAEIKRIKTPFTITTDEKTTDGKKNLVPYNLFLISVTVLWTSGSKEKNLKLTSLRSILN